MQRSAARIGRLPGERRRERRQRVVLSAKVVLAAGPTSDCEIVELSSKGARLRSGPDASLPDEFDLIVRCAGVAYACQVRWRNPPWVGVRFRQTWDLRRPYVARQFHRRRSLPDAKTVR